MRLSARGQKILKAVHLITAVCWVGGALSLLVLNRLTGDLAFTEHAYGLNFAKHSIDVFVVIIPGAVGCLLTGLCYSLLTPWGFKKHGWILAKWVLTVGLIVSGTFYLGPRERFLLEFSKNSGVQELLLQTGDYARVFGEYTAFGLVQSCLLVFLIVLSVWKPKKNKAVFSK